MRSKERKLLIYESHTIPGSPTAVLWKLLDLYVRNTSMEVLDRGLKHALLSIRSSKERVSHKSKR